MSVAVLSAHLDDAVFSATVQLLRPRARMITVFAGAPEAAAERSRWDGTTSAPSAAQRHRERLAEDDRAVATLGCASIRMNGRDNQYRDRPVDLDVLAGQLLPAVSEAAEVWLPAGIGQHPDHIATREAGMRAVLAASPAPLAFLYADLPYTIEYGWPSWVTGEPKPRFLDPDFWVERELMRAGLDPRALRARVVALDPSTRRCKEEAVLCYGTQLPALHLTPDDGARWEACLHYEAAWEPCSRTAPSAPSCG